MNFFDHQDTARRKTGLLVLYFALAVLAIIAAVSLVAFLIGYWMSGATLRLSDWWVSPVFHFTAGATLLIIIFGSLRKLWQLRNGGEALVSMLGAREVPLATTHADERMYRNVVEEMAIASGIPAPRTYILDREPSINAFVAGFRPTEAVICVTEGALERLDREELQGVIAHEFSHIFNADMRINLRLLAVLAGILSIGKVGEFLLYSNTRRTYHVRTGRNEAAGHFAAILLGVAMIIIGYIGLFFGRLIKAAISRQREFLADASSVQFTRNPAGIAGALIKIHNGAGTVLATSHAEDMSHMCFGETVPFHLRSFLATHPPVDERLKAIGPSWLARARVRKKQAMEQPAPDTAGHAADGSVGFVGSQPVATGVAATAAMGAAALVGTVTPQHIQRGQQLHAAIPEALHQQLHQPEAAQWLMFALAINASKSEPETLVSLLELSSLEARILVQTCEQVKDLDEKLRLPMIDLAIPTLKHLDKAQRQAFLAQLDALVKADNRITPFEFVLTRILANHLAPKAQRAGRIRFRRFKALRDDIQVLFSLLTHVSGARDDEAVQLFRAATASMLDEDLALLPAKRCKLPAIEEALENLGHSTPMIKATLFNALADLVLADGEVRAGEAELLRAICTLLDCPMPPLESA